MRLYVAVIYGGEGCEREISKRSAHAIIDMLDKTRFSPLEIEISVNGGWRFESGIYKGEETFPAFLFGKSGFITKCGILPICAAIIALHGDFGEDGIIQGALTAAHIKYIGQDIYASASTADKALTKLVAQKLSIPTSPFIISVNETAEDAEARADGELGYPMFIKPARLGSSIGASPAKSKAEFMRGYSHACSLSDGHILIERLVDFKLELECAYLGADREEFLAGGIISADGFYDYHKKYDSEKCVAIASLDALPERLRNLAEEYSRRLVLALGIRYLSRIDFFVTHDENLVFNEINTFPGMTSSSLYPSLTELMGYRRGEFINLLLSEILK